MGLLDEMQEEFTLFPIRRDQRRRKVKGYVIVDNSLYGGGVIEFYFRAPYEVRAGDILRRILDDKEFIVKSEPDKKAFGVTACRVAEC